MPPTAATSSGGTLTITAGAGTAALTATAAHVAGIVEATEFVHLAAASLRLDGLVSVTSATGRLLLNAQTALVVTGQVNSTGKLEINSGVGRTWTLDQLTAPIARADLRNGTVTVTQKAVVYAAGGVLLQAGGDVTFNADADPIGQVTYTTPVTTTPVQDFHRRHRLPAGRHRPDLGEGDQLG